METSPEALARRVQAGDRQAYAGIVELCQNRLRAALGGYCRSANELEELCHTAFLEAYSNLSEFDPSRGPFMSWLLAIGRNCLLMDLRRRKAEGERAARYLEQAAATASTADLERRLAALETCLAELSPADRDLIDARYRQRLSSERLGERLGKTAGAVRMLLQRLRERLRACIERRLNVEGAL